MPTRTARGFHRIGIVLAFPVLLLACCLGGQEAWLQWSTPGVQASYKSVASRPVHSGPVTDPVLLKALDAAALDPVVQAPHVADYTTPMILLGLAVALYAAARAVGWIVDGFLPPTGGAQV